MCILLAGLGNVWGQSTFSWNGTYGGTGTNRTFTGNAVLGVTMTATIVNSEDVWQESSPKWTASGSTSALGTSCSALTTTNQGLLLSTNWTTNLTQISQQLKTIESLKQIILFYGFIHQSFFEMKNLFYYCISCF
jgi:hypothetical protein